MDLSNFQDKDVLEFLQSLNTKQDMFKGLSGRVIDRETVKDLFHFMKQRFGQCFVAGNNNNENSSSNVKIKGELDESTDGYLVEIKKEVEDNEDLIGHHEGTIRTDSVLLEETENEQITSSTLVKEEFDSSCDEDYLIEIKKEVNDNDDTISNDPSETNSHSQSDTEPTAPMIDHDNGLDLNSNDDGPEQEAVQQQLPHQCSMCDRSFQCASWLKRHLAQKHSTLRPFHCDVADCGKAYKTKGNLTLHNQLVHQKVLSYHCNHSGCGQSFVSKQTLKIHQRTHSDQRPYRCTEVGCEKAFKRGHHLTGHMLIHTKGRPFKCTVDGCGKGFTQSHALIYHMQTHTSGRPIKCTQTGCKKTFKRERDLATHLRITHSNERRFKCTVVGCDKSFKRKRNLNEHLRRHEGTGEEEAVDEENEDEIEDDEDNTPAWEIKEESDDECQLVMPQVYKTSKQFI